MILKRKKVPKPDPFIAGIEQAGRNEDTTARVRAVLAQVQGKN